MTDATAWAKWFIDHGFVIIPLRPGDKRPAVEWKGYAERKLTDDEKQKFLEMISEGYNYAVLGGHNDLVVLDFEDYELAERWVGHNELDLLCRTTLCVKTPHGGLHVYVVADEVPPHKFNPAFVQGVRTAMDLQGPRSYVVGPGSCVNHRNCETEKCPWRGEDVVTCYEPLADIDDARVAEVDLKGLLEDLVERGVALGVKPSTALSKWLDGATANEGGTEEELEELKEELKKYDRFKGRTVEAVREELCETAKRRLETSKGSKAEEVLSTVKAVLCDGKTYSEVGIDRSRGDWRLLTFMFANGATDLDVVMQLLPPDSKFFAPKWDRYDVHTIKKAWEAVRPWVTAFRQAKDVDEKGLRERSTVVITDVLMRRYDIKTFYQIKPTHENIIGIFVWNPEKGVYEPFEARLRKEARELIEFFVPLVAPLKEDGPGLFRVSKGIIDDVIDEIKDKTLTELPEEPLRIAFKNVTLEWVIGKYGRYVPKIIEDREPVHFAFHYVPHKLRVDELVAVDREVKEVGDITVGIIEGLARRVCPKSLEVFKQWAGERWITLFEIIGYTLFPKIEFRKAFMILGPKGAGKSTFINLFKELLGPENVTNVPLRNLFGERNRFTLVELYHKLVNAVSETKEYSLDDMDTFKALTGGDRITADVKFKDPVSFVPYAKLVVATNRPPQVRDKNDDAFWHRWLIVEFNNQFPDDTSWSRGVFTEEELEGILTVAVLAFSRVLLHGHFDYEQTEAEVKAIWLSTTDSVFSFVDEYTRQGRLVLDPSNGDLTVRVKELYRIYMEYCKDNGFRGVGKKTFVRKLREYFGVTVQRKYVEVDGEKKRARFFVGITIADNSVLPETRTATEVAEFLDYIRNNNGVTKAFGDIVRDFGGDRVKANRLLAFCTSKRLCNYVGVDVVKFGTA